MEHQVDPREVDGGADDGEDPVHIGAGGPTEDEETDRDTDSSDECDFKADFGCETTVADEARFDVVLLVQTWGERKLGPTIGKRRECTHSRM